MNEVRRRIEGSLAELGDTPEDVAAQLNRLGCRGQRKHGEDCPVHNFLTNRVWLDVSYLHVDYEAIEFDDGHDLFQRADVPDAVAEFITRFDKGEWDFLAKEEN